MPKPTPSMQAYLLKIWQNVDVTVFFVTHDLDEAIYLSDRILVLRANPGEIDELIEVPVPRPRHPVNFSPRNFLPKKRLEEIIRPLNWHKTTNFPWFVLLMWAMKWNKQMKNKQNR